MVIIIADTSATITCTMEKCVAGEEITRLLDDDASVCWGRLDSVENVTELTEVMQRDINYDMKRIEEVSGLKTSKYHYGNVVYLFFLAKPTLISMITTGKYVFDKVIPVSNDSKVSIKISLTFNFNN